ncbi:MAG: EAL domain-containing protein, partial [Rhodobacteraceae bacterium]|nr:EAL domain-containing protein [Paracoccaceae bacterium]
MSLRDRSSGSAQSIGITGLRAAPWHPEFGGEVQMFEAMGRRRREPPDAPRVGHRCRIPGRSRSSRHRAVSRLVGCRQRATHLSPRPGSHDGKALGAALRNVDHPARRACERSGATLLASAYRQTARGESADRPRARDRRLRRGRISCLSSGSAEMPVWVPPPAWQLSEGVGVLPVTVSQGRGVAPQIRLTYRDHTLAVDQTQLLEHLRGIDQDVSLALFHLESDRPLAVFGDPSIRDLRPRVSETDVFFDGRRFAVSVRSASYPIVAVVGDPSGAVEQRWYEEALTLGVVAVLVGSVVSVIIVKVAWRRMSPRSEIRYAVKATTITAVYQAVIELATGRCVGAEALARWHRSDGAVVRPDAFIPFAEDNGLISLITDQMITHVIEDMGDLLRRQRHFQVAINIAPQELENDRIVGVLQRAARGSRTRATADRSRGDRAEPHGRRSGRGVISRLRAA